MEMINTPRAALDAEFADIQTTLSDDEMRVLVVQARRMSRIGHGKYGRLDLAKERRDWNKEMAAESSDRLFYEACREVARAERKRELVEQFKAAQHDHWNSLIENDVCTGCGMNAFDDGDSTPTGEFTPVGNRNADSLSSPISPAPSAESLTPGDVPQSAAGAGLSLEVGGETVLVPPFCEDCNAPVDLGHADGCAWTTIVPGKEGSAA